VFSSPKGYGISGEYDGRYDGSINNFTIYADIYGMPTARTREAGVVATFTHNYIVQTVETEFAVFDFFAGAGASTGYVHDFEAGFFRKTNRELQRERSVMVALAGDAGVHADFGRRISLELSFTANLGIAMRRNRSNGAMLFSFYKNGVFQTLYPQISIMFRL